MLFHVFYARQEAKVSSRNDKDEVARMLTRVETKLDVVIQMLMTGRNAVSDEDIELMRAMTTKQHAVAQMILRGTTSKEIGERFGVTENTAKVHVRLLARKMGVHTRSQIVARLQVPMKNVAAPLYLELSGGLPKDWDENYEDDPMDELVRG